MWLSCAWTSLWYIWKNTANCYQLPGLKTVTLSCQNKLSFYRLCFSMSDNTANKYGNHSRNKYEMSCFSQNLLPSWWVFPPFPPVSCAVCVCVCVCARACVHRCICVCVLPPRAASILLKSLACLFESMSIWVNAKPFYMKINKSFLLQGDWAPEASTPLRWLSDWRMSPRIWWYIQY